MANRVFVTATRRLEPGVWKPEHMRAPSRVDATAFRGRVPRLTWFTWTAGWRTCGRQRARRARQTSGSALSARPAASAATGESTALRRALTQCGLRPGLARCWVVPRKDLVITADRHRDNTPRLHQLSQSMARVKGGFMSGCRSPPGCECHLFSRDSVPPLAFFHHSEFERLKR